MFAIGPGDFGGAIQTVVSLAALAVVGTYTFAFAAHAFFTIADGTGAGQNEVSWLSEPIVDRLGKAFLLAWTILVCASPAFIMSRIATGGSLTGNIFALSVASLLFPIILLSMQSVGSWLALLHPEALGRLLKRPEHLLCYYLMLVPVLAASVGGWWLLLRVQLGLIPGALVLAYVWLVVARLFGRLALCVGRVGLKKKKQASDEEDEVAYYRPPPPRQSTGRRRHGDDDFEDDSREPKGRAPTPTLKRVWVEEGADDPYALVGGATPEPQPALPDAIAKPSEFEVKLASPRRPLAPPKHPWLIGTYDFPFWPSNWMARIWLGTGLMIAGFLARIVFAG